MKAPEFRYERPATLGAALDLLADDSADAIPLAGGQSLVPMMNFRMAMPDVLVDLNWIDELAGISETSDSIEIGAMTRYAALGADPRIAQHLPLMAAALPHIAHAAIRNRGTIGGSVALADPAAEMPAVLKAIGASIRLIGSAGSRTVTAEEFFTGVYETCRDEHELVQSINCPKARSGQHFGFYELARRHGDYAMAGVAISVHSIDPIQHCRLVFFGVSDVASHATEAETLLNGTAGAPADIDAACDAVRTMPMEGDLQAKAGTKQHLAAVALRRALKEMLNG